MEVNDKYEFNEVDTTFLVCQLTTQSNGRVIWQMESPHPNPPSFQVPSPETLAKCRYSVSSLSLDLT